MAWLCIASLVLVSVIDAHADDRAKQRAEARIFTQMEQYEAWQEEVESELERLRGHTEAGPYSKQFSAQWEKVNMTRRKGRRILLRINRACEQIAERWPPAPPECQEERRELQRFFFDTHSRQSDIDDMARGE